MPTRSRVPTHLISMIRADIGRTSGLGWRLTPRLGWTGKARVPTAFLTSERSPIFAEVEFHRNSVDGGDLTWRIPSRPRYTKSNRLVLSLKARDSCKNTSTY